MTTEEFIRKAREVHGDKYDYSKVQYVDAKTKVCIICHEHGKFWITPNKHLSRKSGCPKCSHPNANMTKEEFIAKATKIHGDKYDYSKVNWVNVSNLQKDFITIICHEHGEFKQRPYSHMNGTGCPKCARPNANMTTEEFIAKAKEVHDNKYDYSKTKYVDAKTKVCIICPKHGKFWQTPDAHLAGKGCLKCVFPNKNMTKDEFIKRAKEIHGEKYDYSKVEYVDATKTKVCIICPKHGKFWQTPSSHLQGHCCKKCVTPNANMTTEEFIEKAREIHGDKYDYSKVEYVDTKTKVCIICPIHGEFWQSPNKHLSGQGCPKCKSQKIRDSLKLTLTEFIKRSKKIHDDKYDYSKVEYTNFATKVCIICPEHGEFWQTPNNHLAGKGCPNCSGLRKEYKFNLLQEFESEYAFRAFLANNDINILQVILRNIEPKFESIKRDIEEALMNVDDADPIQSLEDKYRNEEEEDNENEVETIDSKPIFEGIDLDDDEAVNAVLTAKVERAVEDKDEKEPTIEDVVKNNEQELQVINRIEHMLTPEDREYIMKKFLNDKRRVWIAERESKLNK